MRSRTFAGILFVITLLALIVILSFVFRVKVQPGESRAATPGAATVAPAPLVEVEVEIPVTPTPMPGFREEWGRYIDISDWKAWGEPLPVIRAEKGRNGSWALDPSGDGNYSSGVTSRFQVDLRQGAAIEFWARARTSHQYWQSMDVGFSQSASVEAYAGIENQPAQLVSIHIGAETDQNYIEYVLGDERQREVYSPLGDEWHFYRLEIDPDGAVRFYRDGELKFAPKSKIDFDLFPVLPIVIEGRSYQTDVLLDDLAIYGVLVPAGPLVLESNSPFFRSGQVITETSGFVRSPILADLDGDGDPDIVLSSVGVSRQILAFENPGLPGEAAWRQHVIGKGPTPFFGLASIDFDSDGDLDIASTGGLDGDFKIHLWQNNGNPFGEDWTQINVGTSNGEVLNVLATDLNGDGSPDLITGAAGEADVELMLWENPGSDAEQGWLPHELGATDDTVYTTLLADIDNDGDLDLISGGRRDEDYELIAWINDGAPFDNPWQSVNIGDAPGDVYSLALVDVDGDGDLDLFSSGSWHADPQIALWQNDGTPLDGLWESSPVGTLPANVLRLVAEDVDNDGRMDLISSSAALAQESEIILWQSDGSPFAAPWTPHPIGETGQTTRMAAADLNGDGVLDLVTGGESLLTLWEGVHP